MNIYIGNLHPQVLEAQVRDLFRKFGTIASVNLIVDMETGLSKGFGFVVIEEANDAKKAIKELNTQEFMGQALEVEEAKPRPETANKFMEDARRSKSAQQNTGNRKR